LDENFDDRSYANNIIQGRAISDSLARLADGINLLDKELHSQVCCFVFIKLLEWLFCLGYRCFKFSNVLLKPGQTRKKLWDLTWNLYACSYVTEIIMVSRWPQITYKKCSVFYLWVIKTFFLFQAHACIYRELINAKLELLFHCQMHVRVKMWLNFS